MHRFEVWAPLATRVDLVLHEERRLPMTRAKRGYWALAVAEAGPGTRYAFAVDGGPPRPDPRSLSQPDGVHGFSEVRSLSEFRWTDGAFRGLPLSGAVLYELHIGTFTEAGTFEAAIARLPHLVDLGIDAVEVMPLAEFPGERGWGYDGASPFAVHHAYGGPKGFQAFVDACHGYGLGVILDVVYNHLGPSGNYLSVFGPYFDDHHHTNWGAAVNFDGAYSDGVRRYFIDHALCFLRDFHCDGLRLDATHAIMDESAVHVLEQMSEEVQALAAHVRRPLHLIAEDDRNAPRLVRPRSAGGYGLSACWADEWHHALHGVLTGESMGYYEDFGALELLAKALRQAWVFDGTYSEHRKRHHGAPPTGFCLSRLIAFTQNHDHTGNRARGERLCHLVSPGRAKIAAALLLTGPFTPMLFQGEEWAASSPFQYFTDHQEPELGRAVSEGRKREFRAFLSGDEAIPNPQARSTFENSKLHWDELEAEHHAETLRFYRTLIALRRQYAELANPAPESVRVTSDSALGFLCVARGALAVLVNLGAAPVRLRATGLCEVLLASEPAIGLEGSAIELPVDAVVIVQRETPHAPVTVEAILNEGESQ